MEASDKPIYIVGGGKTAMDTVFQFAKKFPDKTIHMLVGKGTAFFNRNKIFPKGLKRYVGGILMTDVIIDLSMKFNGVNEAETFDYFMEEYALSLDADAQHNFAGIMSEEEMGVISNKVNTIHHDYLEDVIDYNGSPAMRLRSGELIPVEKGSWFINCTGFWSKKKPLMSRISLNMEQPYQYSIHPSCCRSLVCQPTS
ncbi:MAG: hypothetical protein AAF629_24915 [Chloroflexota bacterium]